MFSFFIFIYYHFFRKDSLFCLNNNVCLYKLYLFSTFLKFISSNSSFFIFFYFFYLFFFMFPYFRGNSLNSRADLEFKEFRFFSTMIFQKKIESLCFFFKNPNGFMIFRKNNAEFQVFLEKSSWTKVEIP